MKTLFAAGLVLFGVLVCQAADKPVRIEPQAASQNLIKKVDPALPALAKQMGVAGPVVVDVTISPEGRVSNLKAISGNPILLVPVLDAVKQWEYKPFTHEGQPITVITRVEWSFPSLSYTKSEEAAVRDYYPAFQSCYNLVHAENYSEAEKKCSQAVKLSDQLPPQRIIERSSSRTFLAHSMLHQNRLNEAIPLYEKAVEIRGSLEHSDRDADFAGENANLARAYFLNRQLDKADLCYSRAVPIFEAAIAALPEEKHHYVPWFKEVLLEYAKLETAKGEPEKAKELEQKAAALQVK